jgi:hypothetical protein
MPGLPHSSAVKGHQQPARTFMPTFLPDASAHDQDGRGIQTAVKTIVKHPRESSLRDSSTPSRGSIIEVAPPLIVNNQNSTSKEKEKIVRLSVVPKMKLAVSSYANDDEPKQPPPSVTMQPDASVDMNEPPKKNESNLKYDTVAKFRKALLDSPNHELLLGELKSIEDILAETLKKNEELSEQKQKLEAELTLLKSKSLQT